MSKKTKSPRIRSIGTLVAVGALVAATQVGGLGTSPVQAQEAPAPWSSGAIPLSTADVLGGTLGDTQGTREGMEGEGPNDVVLGNNPGEPTAGNIDSDRNESILSPIDSSFTTDEVDFFGATPRNRDGDPLTGDGYVEGYAGDILDGEGNVIGIEVSDVATDLFRAGAPLGTWAAGLGGESIKASTEHFTVMESILTCYQTHPYDYWTSEEDWNEGLNPTVLDRTNAALIAEGKLPCTDPSRALTDPSALEGFAGEAIDFDTLIPNEDSVIMDMAIDPDLAYSATKKDDGKLLFRWGTAVKRPTDIRIQQTIELPREWTEAVGRGFRVTRAELVVNHNITNNPNDQIRPEDWENEAATGRLPNYTVDEAGNWYSVDKCYEGDGDFIPPGTQFKYPSGAIAGVPASDLQQGFTPAWYTSIQRDPFQWSYRQATADPNEFIFLGSRTPLVPGAPTPEQTADGFTGDETLVSGPRWRLTPNKFGQDLPGLEIPEDECSQPPYQQGTKRYETGDPTTTTINLLDWNQNEPRWVDAASPLAYSGGWISTWDPNAAALPGQLLDAEDAGRCVQQLDGDCITDLGTTLTDGFDVVFYVKGDVKPAQIYNTELILEWEEAPPITLDHGDAPDTYGTLTASNGPSATVAEGSPTLGTLVDSEDDGQPTPLADGDDLADDDDEDGVTFGALKAGAQGTATATLAGSGYVSGWIDFNGDGDFADAGEQVVTDATVGGAFGFAVPADAKVGATFARFRASDMAGVGHAGYGGNGEVEDHPVTILAADPIIPPDPPDPTEASAPFTNIVPTRVLDTRISGARLGEWSGSGPLLAGTTAQIPVRSAAGIPADATVAVVNLTATEALAGGFLTVYPCGGPVPTISNLNYPPTTSRAATAFAPISATGSICVYTHSTTDVVVDVTGYTPQLGSYTPLTPVRLTDTRTSAPVAAGGTLRVTPPSSSADALAVSVVAVDATAPGFLTVFPCSRSKPTTSTVNFGIGDPSANLTVIENEQICVYSHSATHVVVDLHGEFTEPLLGGQARLLDTRSGPAPTAAATTVLDPARLPALAGLKTAAVNLTSTDSTAGGFLTVWPCSAPKPTASILNYNAGQVVANLAVVDVTSPICIYNHSATHVVVDLVTGLS